jgi:hypothetical protein
MELSVPVDGGHLWADDTGGDGPVLVLLHPGWGDSSIWLPVLDKLPSHYRVIRLRVPATIAELVCKLDRRPARPVAERYRGAPGRLG